MVTVIWGAEVGAIITVGAEAAGITMDGHAADIAAGAKSNPAIAVVALVTTTHSEKSSCNDRRSNRFRADHCVLNGCRF